jgi:ferredoxin
MKVTVDAELCTGCGLCEDTCPAVFEMGDDEVAVVKVNEVPDESADDCRQAAEDCPTEAIVIAE